MFSSKKKTSFKVRVDIKQWGTTLGENLSALPKVQAFNLQVQDFFIVTNCLNTLAQLAKGVFLFTYMRIIMFYTRFSLKPHHLTLSF